MMLEEQRLESGDDRKCCNAQNIFMSQIIAAHPRMFELIFITDVAALIFRSIVRDLFVHLESRFKPS